MATNDMIVSKETTFTLCGLSLVEYVQIKLDKGALKLL